MYASDIINDVITLRSDCERTDPSWYTSTDPNSVVGCSFGGRLGARVGPVEVEASLGGMRSLSRRVGKQVQGPSSSVGTSNQESQSRPGGVPERKMVSPQTKRQQRGTEGRTGRGG